MRRIALLWVVLFASSCSDVPSDETPRGTVRLFLSAMARSDSDPSALREAYTLLSASSRRSLVERARFAESLGASELAPWDMLVRGRFRQTFTPARGVRGMREEIEGDAATVIVMNADESRRAQVPLVREEGRWRVVLQIPPVRGGG